MRAIVTALPNRDWIDIAFAAVRFRRRRFRRGRFRQGCVRRLRCGRFRQVHFRRGCFRQDRFRQGGLSPGLLSLGSLSLGLFSPGPYVMGVPVACRLLILVGSCFSAWLAQPDMFGNRLRDTLALDMRFFGFRAVLLFT